MPFLSYSLTGEFVSVALLVPSEIPYEGEGLTGSCEGAATLSVGSKTGVFVAILWKGTVAVRETFFCIVPALDFTVTAYVTVYTLPVSVVLIFLCLIFTEYLMFFPLASDVTERYFLSVFSESILSNVMFFSVTAMTGFS